MKDIFFPRGYTCDGRDKLKLEMIIKADDGQCWKNIHPHELNVFDFTFWASNDDGAHPGNSFTRNPIKEFAEAGKHRLAFPSWYNMGRWYTNNGIKIQWIGRFGDSINFIDLPEVLKRDVNEIFGLLSDKSLNSKGTVVCGSPGEVANDYPSIKSFEEFDRSDVKRVQSRFHYNLWWNQRNQVWTEVTLTAPDQLRQRVSW